LENDEPPAQEPSTDVVRQHDQDESASLSSGTHAGASGPSGKPQQVSHLSPEDRKKAFDEIFQRDVRFADLGLAPPVLRGITEQGFEHPTAIQARIIPVILSGRDVLGQAKTGTGKTAAFGLPMLSMIQPGDRFGALVLVPTRELALQAAGDLRDLGKYTGLRVLPVYGGQNINTQAKSLSQGPEVIIATPGRMMDMVQRGYVNYSSVKMVVLDEVDRMLDIGFRDDIRKILSQCPKDRQTVFVSATIQPEIESLARSHANNCEKIVATAGALTVALVKQLHLTVEPWDKKQLLLHLLTHEEPALTIVFCRTKRTVDNLAEYLTRKGIEAHAMHGDMPQGKRNQVIERLHKGTLSVLIASDLASRGLDVEGITHVINYDLPDDPDLYVHRIGRTARAGRDGIAWSLVTPEQGELLTQIEMLINAEIPKLDYPDFKPGPVPADVADARARGVQRTQMARSMNRYTQTLPPLPTGTGGPEASPGLASANAVTLDADPSRFPGGVVPSKLPPKRLMGRVKTARSMKAAIAQAAAANLATPGLQPVPGSPPDPPSAD
jgi:ATP-dependent RNA helicase DeaD